MKSITKKGRSKSKEKSPLKSHKKSIKVVVHKAKSKNKTVRHSAKAAKLILKDFEKDIESGNFVGPIQVVVEAGKSKKARQFVGGQVDMAETMDSTSSLPMKSVPDTTIVKPEETSSQPTSMIMPTGTMMQPNAPPQSGTMVSDTTSTMSEPVTQAQQPVVVSQPQTQPQQQAIPSVTVNISAPATTAPFGGPTQQTTDDTSTTVSKADATPELSEEKKDIPTPEQTPSLGLLSMPTEEGKTKEVESESDETTVSKPNEPETTPVDEPETTPVDEPETINVVTSDAETKEESKPITVDDETALLDKIASSLREESSQLQSLSTEISKSKSMNDEETADEEMDETTTKDEESSQQQPSIPEDITTSPSAEVKQSEPSPVISQPPLTPATPPSPTFVQKMSELPKKEAKTIDNVRMASHHLFNWVNESLFGDDTKANSHFSELQKYITNLFPTGEKDKKEDDSLNPMELVGGRKRKYKKKSKGTKKKNMIKRETKKEKKATKKGKKKYL